LILTVTLNPSIDRRYSVHGFSKGKIHRAKEVQYTPGGKGLNVTKVINVFGEEVFATGFLGGKSGEYIHDRFVDMGIMHEFIQIKEETRSCLAIISDDGIQTEILEEGPRITREELIKFYELYTYLINKSEIICISGSLPLGVPKDIYRDLIAIANRNNKIVILDTSGGALEYGIEAIPYMVKPNKEELEDLLGIRLQTQGEIVKAGKYLIEKGIKIVIISLGNEGAIVLSEDQVYRINIPEVEAINPVGSGDSMIAGFAVAMKRNYDYDMMLKLGVACGIANAMEAETGKVEMNNVKRLMGEIKLSSIYY
jgi:tagatose 6-phosphate kinase